MESNSAKPSSTPTALRELLAANQAFYDAFASRDADAMDRLWARRMPVVCIHPGWEALHGREEVVSSWRAILKNSRSPRVRCAEVSAHLHGELALVVCTEAVDGNHLAATNVFIREDGDWRLMHHHAGPVAHAVPRSKPSHGLLN